MDPNEENFKKKKMYLMMGILIILALVVLRSLIVSNNNAIIDYGSITSGVQITVNGELIKDREIYYIIENILTKFATSYSDTESDYVVEDYYDVLNKSYKNRLGRTKFLEIVDNFFKKLTIVDSSGMGTYTSIQVTGSINSIYEIDKDTYICMLNSKNSNLVSYIGIKLDTENNTYEIFYLE